MKIDVAVKIIIVLLVIMIVSLAAALIIINKDEKPDSDVTTESQKADTTESDTTKGDTTAPESTTPDESDPPVSSTEPNTTTKPTETEPPTTEPPTTEPPVTEPPVTEPPVTEPPVDIPSDLLVEKSFYSDTGKSIALRADVKAYEKDGKVCLRVDLYLEHYSISIKSKAGTLFIGDKELDFTSDPISYDDNKTKGKTLLYSYETEVEYEETVSVAAELDIRMTYGGTKYDTISLDGTVTVE